MNEHTVRASFFDAAPKVGDEFVRHYRTPTVVDRMMNPRFHATTLKNELRRLFGFRASNPPVSNAPSPARRTVSPEMQRLLQVERERREAEKRSRLVTFVGFTLPELKFADPEAQRAWEPRQPPEKEMREAGKRGQLVTMVRLRTLEDLFAERCRADEDRRPVSELRKSQSRRQPPPRALR